MNNIMKKIKQLCQNKRKLNAEKYINKLKDNLQSLGSPEQVYIRYGIIRSVGYGNYDGYNMWLWLL